MKSCMPPPTEYLEGEVEVERGGIEEDKEKMDERRRGGSLPSSTIRDSSLLGELIDFRVASWGLRVGHPGGITSLRVGHSGGITIWRT